jgi:hypothetical protein
MWYANRSKDQLLTNYTISFSRHIGLFIEPSCIPTKNQPQIALNGAKSVRSGASACPWLNGEQLFISFVWIGETGFLAVILNEPAGDVKDLCFDNDATYAVTCI